MRRIALLATWASFPLVVCDCGNPCSPMQGYYGIEMHETSGTCGRMLSGIDAIIPAGTNPSPLPLLCTGVREDVGCQRHVDVSCTERAGDIVRVSWLIPHSADGSSATGSATLSISFADGRPMCTSTYDINYTRISMEIPDFGVASGLDGGASG